MNDNAILGTAQAVMCAVADTLDVPVDQIETACRVMRERIKAFLFDEEHRNVRECVALGTIHPNYAMALLVAEAIEGVAQLPGVKAKGVRS